MKDEGSTERVRGREDDTGVWSGVSPEVYFLPVNSEGS